MRLVLLIVLLGGLAALALQLWLRLYPHDFSGFHRERPIPDGGDTLWTLANGVTVSVAVDASPVAVLERLDRVIRATHRTEVLAGATTDGAVSYVTRTAFWGFPDLTYVQATVEVGGTRLLVRGTAAFAGYDWGVNRARVTVWFEAAGLPVPPEDTASP